MRGLSILAGVVLAGLLGGCAALRESEEQGVVDRLKQAGFRPVAVSAEELAQMKPYRLEGKVSQGRIIYRYAETRQGRVFVGGQREYERYRAIEMRTKERRVTNLAQIGPRRTTGPLLW